MEDKMIIVEDTLDVEPGSLKEDTKLVNLEEWDSLAKLNIMALAKKRKGLAIDADQLMDCKTVSDLFEFL